VSEIGLSDFLDLFGSAIAASLVAAALCGYLGFFVVLRRVSFVSAALGQISGLGVAAGFLFGALAGVDPHEPTPLYLDPVVLALVLTGAASAVLSYVPRLKRAPPESVVALAYLASTALVLIVLANPIIVNEAHEVGDLLFGNAVAVRREHLVELAAVAAVVLITHVFFFKDLLLVSYDLEMAQALRLPVRALELGLNLSIGVAVAAATRAVGALPVFGFLVLPAGAALLAAESVAAVIALSVAGAVVAAGLGFYLSFVESWPTGPMVVVVAAAYWPLAAAVRLIRRGAGGPRPSPPGP
jgi:zinc transport system permease protein